MPHSKLLPSALLGLFLVLTFGTTIGAAIDADKLEKTIVVQTPLQNYDQPTVQEYEECETNRDGCLRVCNGDVSCIEECPVCPELYEKPLMVQGVNDTDVIAPSQTPVNTTNIIKLTNEINNIIEHQIQNRNQVNVQVQQNVSQVGGRFGLGYSDQGSCCYVVRMNRDCEKKGSEGCHEKSRQRVCGERCQARVMLVKLVVECDPVNPEDCHETIQYVPRRRRVHSRKQIQTTNSQPCQYFGNNWPYFTCGQGQGQPQEVYEPPRVKRSTCQECLNLPYGYIVQNGLPAQCGGCFGAPMMPMYNLPYMYNPYMPSMPSFPSYGGNIPGNKNDKDDKDDQNEPNESDDDGFVECEGDDDEKCLNDKYGSLETPNEDQDYNVQAQRRKRHQSDRHFVRSIYSKRNRNDN